VLSVGGEGARAWKLQLESGSDVVIEVMTWFEACLEADFLHSWPYVTLKPPLGSPRSHKYCIGLTFLALFMPRRLIPDFKVLTLTKCYKYGT